MQIGAFNFRQTRRLGCAKSDFVHSIRGCNRNSIPCARAVHHTPAAMRPAALLTLLLLAAAWFAAASSTAESSDGYEYEPAGTLRRSLKSKKPKGVTTTTSITGCVSCSCGAQKRMRLTPPQKKKTR